MNKLTISIGTILTLAGLIWGGSSAWTTVANGQEKNAEKIVEVKTDIKENKVKINDNENMNLQQMIILERVVKTLDKLEEKLK